MKESALLKKFLVEYSADGHRLWRMQSGLFWNGKSKRIDKPTTVTLGPGDVVIRKARRVRVGFPGLSDTIGFTKVKITPEMVGRTVAIFTAAETKGEKTKVRPEQIQFVRVINQSGGIGVIAKKLEHLFEAVNKFIEGNHETKH